MHIIEDIRAYKKNDPAARSVAEILLLYNGLHATIDYRIAHWLHIHGLRFLAAEHLAVVEALDGH